MHSSRMGWCIGGLEIFFYDLVPVAAKSARSRCEIKKKIMHLIKLHTHGGSCGVCCFLFVTDAILKIEQNDDDDDDDAGAKINK